MKEFKLKDIQTDIELCEDYKDKYCEKCGKEKNEIWENLMKAETQQEGHLKVRRWKGHYLYNDNDYFYEKDLTVRYCELCGEKLDDEAFHTVWESRGKYHGSEEILVGYKCQNCGETMEY